MTSRDNLGHCPLCECDACYIAPISEFANSYFCWGCGYNTTDLMRVGEFDFEELEIGYPELYKDLAKIDSDGRKWYPSTINIPEKGTVFINGINSEDWQWAGILVRELTAEEKEKYAKKNITHLSDTKTLKLFGTDFIEACDYVGVFNFKP